MTAPAMINTSRLPLHNEHAAKGARFGAFGQWEVPLYYTSILEEHQAVRSSAGIFDISHMGEFFFSGPDAAQILNRLLPRDITGMFDGQALYMPLLNEKGGFVDDIIVYRLGNERFLIIVNASNVDKDQAWFEEHIGPNVHFENLTDQFGLLALQGPKSSAIMAKTFGTDQFGKLQYYTCTSFDGGVVARTGYTGEDGFEIMVPKADLTDLWRKLFEAGKDFNLVPAGFGARDTLRLEAGMPLYGHDMDDTITPLEAGIGWTLDWSKAAFPAREVLWRQKEAGVSKKLVGFEMIDRGIPRQGHQIALNGKNVGEVTSGSFSPTLGKNIGMGYVPIEAAQAEREIEVVIRDKALKAKIVKLPFYKRKKNI